MKLVLFFIKLLNSLIPKNKKQILFISRPDFSDNAYYFYRFLKNKNIDSTLSWLIYDKDIYNLLIKKKYKNIYYLRSFKGVWIYFRTKYIITSSSSLWQIKSPFQKQYDLWHGIPLKNVLCMGEQGVKPKRQAGNITKRFATSSLEKALLAASFDFNAINIEITGQPRTDALFAPKGDIWKMLNLDKKNYSKIVIYMPTYRHGYVNREEGIKFSNDNIFRLQSYRHNDFLDFLNKEKILLLLKLHPYEEKIYTNINLGKNIAWINNKKMIEYDMSIYDVLPYVDILLTDYSSVYFDFLLLNRKIIFVAPDLNIYKKNRGFTLEPYEFWTPGEKVFDQESLENILLQQDNEAEKKAREDICNIMHRYQDGFASNRVMNILHKDMSWSIQNAR